MPPIYVEILIKAPMDKLWQFTQDPAIHEQWDLRFSSIRYLPRESEKEPQRFRYATRIGFGLEIVGDGESVTTIDSTTGIRVSSLKFSSDDWRSLIREGGGYWKYVPVADGIRFFTWYDYRSRFGLLGQIFDRVVFRPAMGWATAFSFDSMRLWVERGIHPAASRIQAAVHAVTRFALALVFLWHGIVPKILYHHQDELAMLRDAGISSAQIDSAVTYMGYAEVAFACGLLLFWRRAMPIVLTIFLMLAAIIGVIVFSPRYLFAAFNPVSLNLCVIALAVIDLLTLRNLPTAATCLRKDPEGRL